MRIAMILACLTVCGGCNMAAQPRIPLERAAMAEGPVLIQRGEHYYLRYRRSIEGENLPLRLAIETRKDADAAYYFFAASVSQPEWGQLIERPLAIDDFDGYARNGHVYWLDPDGRKHAIPVRQDGQ